MIKETSEEVGIDGIATYVPRLFVDLGAEWAVARAAAQGGTAHELVEKVSRGLGLRRMAIPDGHEDSATMAAMAAKRLIDRLHLDPRQLGYLAIGTETTVDQSKSIAAYVLGMLSRHYDQDLSHVGCPQFQFACIGATYALEAAVAMIRSQELGDRYAIVIATDVARYEIGGPAECTQGAGAVALLVSTSPRLMVLARSPSSTVTVDERDFFRPNWCSEAVVDGQYSIDVYLDCLDRCLRRADARHGAGAPDATAAFFSDYYLFHTPFPKMAEYAAARLYRRLESLQEGGAIPPQAPPRTEREQDRATARTPAFRSWFDRRCAPGLAHAGDIGNVYSAALYMSFATLVEGLYSAALEEGGGRVSFFSYGSGASARWFTGVLRPGCRRRAVAALAADLAFGAGERPARRRALSLDEYARLHAECAPMPGATILHRRPGILAPSDEFALLRLGSDDMPGRVDRGYRYYGFVPAPGVGTKLV